MVFVNNPTQRERVLAITKTSTRSDHASGALLSVDQTTGEQVVIAL